MREYLQCYGKLQQVLTLLLSAAAAHLVVQAKLQEVPLFVVMDDTCTAAVIVPCSCMAHAAADSAAWHPTTVITA